MSKKKTARPTVQAFVYDWRWECQECGKQNLILAEAIGTDQECWSCGAEVTVTSEDE